MNQWSFLQTDAVSAAKRLLGCEFERTFGDALLRGRIIEVEAYDQTDVASHSYRGETPRNSVMFGPAGYLYVYFTYGMHYCCNVVVGTPGHGAAVLIRALEPLAGQNIMMQNRHGRSGIELTNGPAKLCQALRIDKALNGHDLNQPPMRLIKRPAIAEERIIATPRIGISRGKDAMWRFVLEGS